MAQHISRRKMTMILIGVIASQLVAVDPLAIALENRVQEQKIKITRHELVQDLGQKVPVFPKYTTQLVNLANRNAQATRPRVVGQLSELIQDFPGDDYESWVRWYGTQNPNAIDEATQKISKMIDNLKTALSLVDEKMIREWVKDLVLTKTYIGLKFQNTILKRIAAQKGTTYRLATPKEEAKGIDGYIGNKPVSVKPITYKHMEHLQEDIKVPVIYYQKGAHDITVWYHF